MPVVESQSPSSANAIRVARIALLTYAFCVPTVMGLVADAPFESTLFLPSPRKLLVLVLVAYQVHALLRALSPSARVVVRQDPGGVMQTILVVMIGMPLIHAMHGATEGWFAPRPPVVWLFDGPVPFPEFALLSLGDVLQAPAEVVLGTLVDLAVIFLLGGTGHDTVIDGQRRLVTHGWLRSRTSFDDIVGLARERVDVRSESGRHARLIDRAVIVRRSGAPIPLPLGEPADDPHLDALAAATGLPRGSASSGASREAEQPRPDTAYPVPHIHDPEGDAMPQARPPITPVTVDEDALFADPTRWHGRRIEVVTHWRYAFECSSVGNAWLEVPIHAPISYGTYRVRVVGTWIYPDANGQGGYGHMGGSSGELRAEMIDVLEILDQPQVPRDGLTGLPKRTALMPAFDQAVRTQQPVAVMILDIDRFKSVNDNQGHQAGDEVLRRCTAAIVESLGPGDVVVRWGSNAFAAVMTGATIDVARERLDRVHARVHAIGVTVSAGLVAFELGDTSAVIFERADRALYAAKGRGRNCTVVLDGAS